MKIIKSDATVYISANRSREKKLIGPCGPCAFINLVGLPGTPKLEEKLAESGKLKPLNASVLSSFITWGELYDVELVFYTDKIELSDRAFETMFAFEGTPLDQQASIKKSVREKYKEIIDEHRNSIKIFSDEPLTIIDSLLDSGYVVAFSMAYISPSGRSENLTPHLRVCYKREKDNYFIKDSSGGLMEILQGQILTNLENLNQTGFNHDIVGFKPIN